jgi:hypothetical protein
VEANTIQFACDRFCRSVQNETFRPQSHHRFPAPKCVRLGSQQTEDEFREEISFFSGLPGLPEFVQSEYNLRLYLSIGSRKTAKGSAAGRPTSHRRPRYKLDGGRSSRAFVGETASHRRNESALRNSSNPRFVYS